MYKISILISFLFLSTLAFPQAGSITPYSRIGIGELHKNRVGSSKGMGGVSLALRSNENVNFSNPASYTSIDSMSFIFQVGVADKFSSLQTNGSQSDVNNFNLDYLTMAFPITKWWAGSIGLTPYSSVGYDISFTEELTDSNNITHNYYGDGGINKFYIGQSFKFFDKLFLGFNASYLFGANVISSNLNFDDDGYAFDYQSDDTTSVNGINFDFGLQYVQPINKGKYDITFGGVFSNKQKLSANSNKYVSINYGTSTNPVLDSLKNTGKIELPMTYGAGLSLTDNNRFFIGVDFYTEKWSKTLSFGESDSLSDSQLICFGAEFMPSKDIVNDKKNNYWKTVKYRLGGYMSKTYMSVNGTQINDFGMSFGVGLPIRKSKTLINISFEVGQKGNLTNGLIKENYYGIALNLSLIDTWFYKRKIN